MNRKQIVITALAAAGAGLATYLIRKKRAGRVEPTSVGIERKGAKHRTQAFSRAKNQGGAPHTEQDII